MEASSKINNSMANGIRKHQQLNVQKNTNLQRIIRGNNRFTNYHSYIKAGGKNWTSFKGKVPK